MAGTKEGGAKTAATNKRKYGEGFYADIGKLGGEVHTEATKRRGFASNKELAAAAGAVGGRRSKRGKKTVTMTYELPPQPKSLWQRLLHR